MTAAIRATSVAAFHTHAGVHHNLRWSIRTCYTLAYTQAEVSEAELREISEKLTPEAREALKLRQCAQCLRLAMLGEKFSKCGRCRAVRYCSRECKPGSY
jgi:hypothetical protein